MMFIYKIYMIFSFGEPKNSSRHLGVNWKS